ncbi:YjbF family lipoprotein [Paracoccus sp. TK19116]|uniref:YjbF family lipoprotein n=1 Tax=Paracoccus albicereus TaxID=2922394 RepID=A0ABT1MQR8_9RHOB|nr:YjbF family lipoprotein [Paracoccus albicereus]
MTRLKTTALFLALAGTLAACGSEPAGNSTSPIGLARLAVGEALAGARASREAPASPRSDQDIAAAALRVNPGPLILVGLESAGRTQALAMVGENGDMRTFMTENEQAVILRRGMLVGTKGLGNDLSVAEAGPSMALVLAGRSGQVNRTMRYITGDGLERPLPMTCNIGPGPNPGVMVEDCTGAGGVTFQNSYLASGGAISVSRQWIGPALGYMTIQELRR